MPPDTTAVSSILADPNPLTIIATIVGIIAGLVAITVGYITKINPWLQNKRDRRSLKKRFGAELYPIGVIENSTRYYIEPFCQSLDPAGSEEPRLVYGAKQNLFDAIDDALNNPTEYRYIFLLADSGMGKSTFLLNYYARNLRKRRRKFEFHLIPLGIPDADERVMQVENKKDTVLFLDALDEDTLAIVDHVERLRILLDLSREFAKVLITCRTQFFPKEEEIPQETGIVKFAPREAGEKAEFVFHKLYLSPFTNEQVQAYLRKRYPLRQLKRRGIAKEMVEKIPNLSIRPMLLAHIDVLVTTERNIKYAFELYEEMVEAWLIREEGIVPGLKKVPLRKFSEHLAVDLYSKREVRGAERIIKDELTMLAEKWDIPLDDWQLTGRSLLNRDAVGNYKFAHRSIMEYLFVKRFTDGDESCTGIVWTDQMKMFFVEMFRESLNKKKATVINLEGADISNLREHLYKLRSNPTRISFDKVNSMLHKYSFFDTDNNKSGNGIVHFFEKKKINDQNIVIDNSTGLTWQQSGSEESLSYKNSEGYIQKLNKDQYAGYDDWRLPTLEEAMSLMEPLKKNGKLYTDPIFDQNQEWIWTSDKHAASFAWVVSFDYGICYSAYIYDGKYVRAVC